MPVQKITTPQGTTYTTGAAIGDEKSLADGGHDPWLIRLFEELLEVLNYTIGEGATSTSRVTVGTGSKSFVLDKKIPATVGRTQIMALSQSDGGKSMVGTVTALTEAGGVWTVTADIRLADGNGEADDWIITFPAPGAKGVVRPNDDFIAEQTAITLALTE